MTVLTDAEIASLRSRLDLSNIAAANNVEILRHLTTRQREEFAKAAGVPVLYFGDEVARLFAAEERAVLSAAPRGVELRRLNGVHIGASDRRLSPYLTRVDIARASGDSAGGIHHAPLQDTILAKPDALPFRDQSIDYIVSLYALERVHNPVETVHHWLDVVKPGGGIGIVVSDWHYTWDARNDREPLGHKWNCTSELVQQIFEANWASRCTLERLASYEFRMSFDFVLRKKGTFSPYAPPQLDSLPTGFQLNCEGRFLE